MTIRYFIDLIYWIYKILFIYDFFISIVNLQLREGLRKVTIPRVAVCNIFGQDAGMLADFARTNGFQGIDWSFDLGISRDDFLWKMHQLREFEVRYH